MNSLLVGVGISDRAAPGDDPVADAVTAEALGYDFVSAFDHPVADAATAQAIGYDLVPAAGHPVRAYPTYETQTLLTWVAARTTRIGIVPRVLGVPFRRPALVAKAAESLQRLSRGPLILGLGASYPRCGDPVRRGPGSGIAGQGGRPGGRGRDRAGRVDPERGQLPRRGLLGRRPRPGAQTGRADPVHGPAGGGDRHRPGVMMAHRSLRSDPARQSATSHPGQQAPHEHPILRLSGGDQVMRED
jgi:hypothetical protein